MFRMTIADVFFIRGRGSVATGKIEDGTLRVGDEVLVDGNGPVRVDGIEAFRKVLEQAAAPENVGLLFSKLERSQLKPGAVITGVGGARASAVPGPSPSGPVSGHDPRFASTEQQRAQLLEMRSAGLCTDAQIDESLRGLIFAADHRQWLMKAGSESWFSSSDGESWDQDAPPA
jgi:hypothetical protein